ncbi:MAG: hypothetical protein AAFQ94_01350 [Bacteroidota bacterium]
MKLTLIGLLIALLFCAHVSNAQSTRSVEEVLKQRSVKQTSKKKKKFSLFKKKKSPYKNDAMLRAEFLARMKDNKKRNKKEARLALKPQYSDPSYFGHRRKPKKRPPGKKKFCKECHIVH